VRRSRSNGEEVGGDPERVAGQAPPPSGPETLPAQHQSGAVSGGPDPAEAGSDGGVLEDASTVP
jgi:hypothetical protein